MGFRRPMRSECLDRCGVQKSWRQSQPRLQCGHSRPVSFVAEMGRDSQQSISEGAARVIGGRLRCPSRDVRIVA